MFIHANIPRVSESEEIEWYIIVNEGLLNVMKAHASRMLRRLMLLMIVHACCSLGQTRGLDSLKTALPMAVGKERLAILFALANRLEGIYPKEALEYGREGIAIASAIGDSASLATLYSSGAFCYSQLGDFKQSIQYGEHSLEIATKLQDRKLIASANSTIGITCVYVGQYSKALEHHLEALRIREELGLADGVVRTLNNIGIVYHNIGQYDKAIDYYKRAIGRQESMGDSLQPIRILHNLGFAEFKRGNLNEAMKYHLEALHLAERTHYIGGMAYTLFNLGVISSELKDHGKAFDHLQRSLRLYQILGQKPGIVQVLNALGAEYRNTGQLSAAVRNYEQAAALGRQINAPAQLKVSYEALHAIFETRNQVDMAYKYYKLFSAAKDSLLNVTESNRIAQMSINLEILKSEREVEGLKQEKMLADLILEKNRTQLNLLVLSIASLVIVIIALFVHSRTTRRGRQSLEEKNSELERVNHDLLEKIREVKTLSGLLPICSHCKKIRNDKGYWEQLEGYISHHSQAQFSHGICPSCMQELYPGFVRPKGKE
jgi:tetratricopeptide (TPR) repeat protein